MRITKFVHSCLLVETPAVKVLIDPGQFSFESHLFNVRKLDHLDYIVITHEHGDHYHEKFLQVLSASFPHATIVTNNDLAGRIGKLKLPNPLSSGSEDNLQVFEAKHEPLPLKLPEVLNIGIHVDNKLTHPGDSFAFTHTRDILALPLTGPWGSLKDALKKVAALKPEAVIPVHDWEWHKAARSSRYEMSKRLLKPYGIDFIELENAESIEI